MKFQDKFYDIIGHKKCPSSEKSAEKCIWRKSNFHGILPIHEVTSDDRKLHTVVLSVYLVISYGGAGDVVTAGELVEVFTRVNTQVDLGQNLGSGLHAALQENSRVYITFG